MTTSHPYRVTSTTSSADLGIYLARDERDALDASARDAGYASFADAGESCGDDGSHLRAKIVDLSDLLDVHLMHSEGVVYCDAGTRRYYAADWLSIAALVDGGDYSLWCAETTPDGEGETVAEAIEATGWDVEISGADEDDRKQCECGEWCGEPCQGSALPDDLITVEYMPEYLRGSHEAAGNAGSWPHNGACRIRATEECAARMIEHDGEWCEIVGAQ